MAEGGDVEQILTTPRLASPVINQPRRVIQSDVNDDVSRIVSDAVERPASISGVSNDPHHFPKVFAKQESLSKWNLIYSGKTCVREFFNRIEEERYARELSSEYIVRRFHELLSDSALKYFRSIRSSSICYNDLKSAFYRTFDTVDYEYKIERQLRELKQTETQSARDFVIDIRDLNSKLRSPISESDLLTIIKYNLHPRFYPCLATNVITDIDTLLQVVSNFETFQANIIPKVVAPIKTPESDAAHLLCPKCNNHGHSYRFCPNIPGPICFKCHRPGYITRDCPVCNNQSTNQKN